MREITSFSNPAIKALRGLHERKLRKQAGLFLAEGTRIVTEAMALGWPIRTLVFLKGRDDDPMIRPMIDRARQDDADIIAVPAAVLAKISRKDNPQMVVASFSEAWADADTAFASRDGCWLALDRIRDPGNLGTILRTADAVGAHGVMLIGDCCDAFSVEAVRASMGAVFNVPMLRLDEATFIAKRQTWQGVVLGTALPASVDYREARWTEPLLLMMGNEQAGLTPGLMETADQLIRMPMLGRSDSLNLAVATGISLYEWRRHQPASGQK
ncbi:MAG: TrmH family RNA methyltransferase [Candidatus Puniceispirillales bacterium]